MTKKIDKPVLSYYVNSQRFYNPHAAFLYAAHNCPHEHVYFDVYSSVFDQVNWTQYPTSSYSDLYRRRALQIRNKYEKIVVAFSGGTDSTTMLSAFFDNNIHVDAVYIAYYSDDISYTGCPEKRASWIKKTWPKQSQFTEILLYDLSIVLDNRFRDREWLLSQTNAGQTRFNAGVLPCELSEIFGNKYSAANWALITGNEKPEISPDNRMAYFVDKTLSPTMNRPYVEFFYLTTDMPEIVVKQAHDLAKFQASGNTDYYQLKRSIGVGGDIADVNSQIEKLLIRQTNQFLSTIDFSQVSESLHRLSLAKYNNCMIGLINGYQHLNSRLIKNWSHGLASLQTDSTLIDYMIAHGYLSSPTQGVQSYNGIHSKRYRLFA